VARKKETKTEKVTVTEKKKKKKKKRKEEEEEEEEEEETNNSKGTVRYTKGTKQSVGESSNGLDR
jgi:hypothetical protein